MELARGRNDARVGGEHAVHVRVDLARVRAHRGGERDRGHVGAAAAERRHLVVGRHALEAGDEHDLPGVERLVDPAAADVHDLRLAVDGVRDDPGLRAGERDRVVAEVGDRHCHERAGDPLADRDRACRARAAWAAARPRGEREQLVRVRPIAEQTPTTRAPRLFAATIRSATRRIFSGSATDVPPNFMTTVWTPAGSVSGAVSDIAEDCRDAPRSGPSFGDFVSSGLSVSLNAEPTSPRAHRFSKAIYIGAPDPWQRTLGSKCSHFANNLFRMTTSRGARRVPGRGSLRPRTRGLRRPEARSQGG